MLKFFSFKNLAVVASFAIFLSFSLANPAISNADENASYSFEEKGTQTLKASDYTAPKRSFDIYVPKFIWPVSPENYNEGFGVWRPATKSYHGGLDLMPGYGTTIVSATDGIVTKAEYSGSLGVHVIIYDTGYYTTVYAHMIEGSIPPNIVPGAVVKMGEPIGQVGNTGLSTAPHLHFEIWDGTTKVDPWPVMAKYATG
jgi:murein DD-endopeptidase MepM/ murein hydrolase activator NlpD